MKMCLSYETVNVGDVVECRDGTWTVTYKTPTAVKMRNTNGFFNFIAEMRGTSTVQIGGNSNSGNGGGTGNRWKNLYLRDIYSINGIAVR